MPDVFSKAKRAAVMARIRSRGNWDTELALAALLRRHRLGGWRRQVVIRSPKSEVRSFKVRPDFVFPQERVAVFVDGCFWHGCPRHSPPTRWLRKSSMPEASRPARGRPARTGKRFWREKLAANRARDRAVNRALRAAGWRVVRIWEHELRAPDPSRLVERLRSALRRDAAGTEPPPSSRFPPRRPGGNPELEAAPPAGRWGGHGRLPGSRSCTRHLAPQVHYPGSPHRLRAAPPPRFPEESTGRPAAGPPRERLRRRGETGRGLKLRCPRG